MLKDYLPQGEGQKRRLGGCCSEEKEETREGDNAGVR